MTTKARTAQPPTLPDPGHGRRWEWEQVATNPLRPRSKTWFASLFSRQGNLLGYIGEYPEYGWSGTIKTRRKTVGAGIVPGAWASAEVAAEMLLRKLRDQR
jgi:hypothetical protein